MRYLSDDDLKNTRPAEDARLRSPIPTQVVSNGEFTPLPQTAEQRRVFLAQGSERSNLRYGYVAKAPSP